MLPYDKTDTQSIYEYALALKDKTFEEIYQKSKGLDFAVDGHIDWSKEQNKGKLGNLLEERFFGYEANDDPEPDFPEAGLELKVTPIDITRNNEESAGERLVLTMISFNKPIEEVFKESHAWRKCRNILLIHYYRTVRPAYNNMIKYVTLFHPLEKDIPIIERDYAIITDYIKRGKAEELSESLTYYLGACTKGANSRITVPQYYEPHTRTKTRAFCFKRQYMQYVLDTMIHHRDSKYEIILNDEDWKLLEKEPFDEVILKKMAPFIGLSDKDLCEKFDVDYGQTVRNRAYDSNDTRDYKALWNTIVYRILGIRNNLAEEFQKANVVVKVSRIEENNTMDECISFPQYSFKKVADEKWEDCDVFQYFDETKFFWITFKNKGGTYYLDKAQFWVMPYADLNNIVKKDWLSIQKVIKNGVEFNINGNRVMNNIPGIRQTEILHSRPKAVRSAYRLLNGYERGNVERDADELPQGDYMTKQCFWIKNKYIAKQLGYYPSNAD